MTSAQIRQSFLDFFQEKGHTIVPSSSLLPESPGLLFTNAGMNQFVPIFLNETPCPYSPPRAADTQKCIRAGGKHNDLEDVGLDTYHHTLFEMLGNWSFGDYFKKEAITWAWELVVDRWKFPPQRLYATVYSPDKAKGDPSDFDQEAYDLWAGLFTKAGLDPKVHIVNGNKKDNFWMMGETGPCGPCSEIHVDLTPEPRTLELEKRGATLVNSSDARCMEIWNLVFIQFNANADGSFRPLPAQHVDTGMGFERVCSILQCTKNFTDFTGTISNYETDVFTPIFRELEKISGKKYTSTLPKQGVIGLTDQERQDVAFRVIADHIRTLSLSVADGILPGNNGRNYVLRRILRRAILWSRALDIHEPFFYKLAPTVVDQLSPVFPELKKNQPTIEKILKAEEESFNRTLDNGIALFNAFVSVSDRRSAGVPPAGSGILPEASPSPSSTRFTKRRLPHYEQPYGIYHITFATTERASLSDQARDLILHAIRHFDGTRYLLLAACVMPDHVHILFQPQPTGRDEKNNLIFPALGDLLHSIKSFTAKEINKFTGSSGSVWQQESFDRLMKSDEELTEVFNYIADNPEKSGLTKKLLDYPWLYLPSGAQASRLPSSASSRTTALETSKTPPGETPAGAGGTPALLQSEIPGEVAFKLYDTYGFPLDMTELMARERGLTVDTAGFEKLMQEQKDRSRAAQKKEIIDVADNDDSIPAVEFVGYDATEAQVQMATYKIEFGKTDDDTVKARLYFSPTPFYAEMGGQVGDTGWLEFGNHRVEILDTKKAGRGVAHLTEDIAILDDLSLPAKAVLNLERRALIEAHHSATHLLHWALREVLGTTVGQKGSYVGPDRLRFDFSHLEAMKPDELQKVEAMVNEKIAAKSPVKWQERPYAEVKGDSTIIQFFGDKYGETVRVVDIGGFSKELCAGTHVKQTGKIGVFRIVSEGAIAAGVRRIEALCGLAINSHLEGVFAKQNEEAKALAAKSGTQLNLAGLSKDPAQSWAAYQANESQISNLKSQSAEADKAAAKAKSADLAKRAAVLAAELAPKSQAIKEIPTIIADLGDADPALLPLLAGEFKKSFHGVVVVGGRHEGKAVLGAFVVGTAAGKANAGAIIKEIAPLVGGKGGGKPDLAQGGGTNPAALESALEAAKAFLSR